MNVWLAEKSRAARSGFSLIELLITCSIIALLLGFLAPALTAMRESSRQMACRNKLRQLALAAENYQGIHSVYPIGIVGVWRGSLRVDHFGPIARMLPHLDQADLYRRIDFNRSTGQPDGGLGPGLLQGLDATGIDVVRCPSDAGAVGARCSFSFCSGVLPGQSARTRLSGAYVGQKWLRVADFRDGLSQTVGISEKLVTLGQDFSPRRDIAWVPTPPGQSPSMSPRFWAERCASLTEAPPSWFRLHGLHWIDSTGNLYNHILGPNTEVVACSAAAHYPPAGVVPARSEHPGIVHAAFMDGQARPISDAIDLKIWQALGTRAGSDTALEF